MNQEETIRITQVLLRYYLTIPDLVKKGIKLQNYTEARREVAYTLVKEFNYQRKDVAKVLNCKLPQVSYLIHRYCYTNKLDIPVYISKEHPVVTLHKFILSSSPGLDPRQVRHMLNRLYQTGYRSGYHKARRFDAKAKLGVPQVPPAGNNAPVRLLEAPGHLLKGVKDDPSPVKKYTSRGG